MPVSKGSSPSLRYFLAGLKPLGRVALWAPLGILALVGLGLWQYRNQTNRIAPSPLGAGRSIPETQWIGQETPASTLKPQFIDPDTGLPSAPAGTSGNAVPPEQATSDPNLAPNPSLNPNATNPNNPISPDSTLSPNSSLNPFNQAPLQRQPNSVNPQLQNRTQSLFPPLLPTRSNSNSVSPADNSSARVPISSGFAGARPPFSSGYTPPSQTESPLQRAVNRATAQPNYPQPASVPNTMIPPAAQTAPQPSLYSNSYQPPAYQPPGMTNNYSGNNNSGTANPPSRSQPPASNGGGFHSGF